jgi:hypothetical protein
MSLSFRDGCPCVQIPYHDGLLRERGFLTLVYLTNRYPLLAACQFLVRGGIESHAAYSDKAQHTYSYKNINKNLIYLSIFCYQTVFIMLPTSVIYLTENTK